MITGYNLEKTYQSLYKKIIEADCNTQIEYNFLIKLILQEINFDMLTLSTNPFSYCIIIV